MYPVDVEEGCVVLLGRTGIEETEFRSNPFAFAHSKRIAYLGELLAIQAVAPFCDGLYLVSNALAVYLYTEPYVLCGDAG